MPTLSLPAGALATLRKLLADHVPDAEVWAYGSRVNGHAHEGSDLDLAVRNPVDLRQPVKGLVDLRDALRESNLTMLVDVFDWARIPASFQKNIESEHVVIQSGDTREVR